MTDAGGAAKKRSMPRRARTLVGGYAYHVLNRANGRLRVFRKAADFAAFERILGEAHARVPLRILGYVIMGNHWHFVVWPRAGRADEVSDFFRWAESNGTGVISVNVPSAL